MTQILGVVSRRWTFQVSDRLVTQEHLPGSPTPFDEASNKAVIFQATDAHVVLGYTGRAYLDHIPTDTFISRSLLGVPLSQGGLIYPVGRPESWTDIGRSIERLRLDIDGAFQRLSVSEQKRSHLSVSIVGWRVSRNKRISPIVWELHRRKGVAGPGVTLNRGERWWAWSRGFYCSAVPDLEPLIEADIRADLRNRGEESPDELEKVLIEGLRRCSGARPQEVGRDLLSIVLQPPSQPLCAQLTYLPSSLADATVHTQATQEIFSPWILVPPVAWAPASISDGGGWENQNYVWKMRRLGPSGSIGPFQHSHQPRPPDPQNP